MNKERVIVVAVQTTQEDERFISSLEELKMLAETAGGEVVGEVTQKRSRIDPRTYLGKGRLEDLNNLAEELEVETVIFNQELTPSQVRNIQNVLNCKIIDRMQLILDIFALRANSHEGRLQVELAQQEYLLPRLTGQYDNLSRLGGGIGTRGPGETKLESDRRVIQKRITDIKRELKKVEAHRERNRMKRQSKGIYQIGLVGYTNAGKSTLLNALTDADTFEEDILFATLDPLTRQLDLDAGMQVTLTDTVGFIQDLPTELVESFQSTLEETRQMDLILHVIDASSPYLENQEDTVIKILEEMGMDHIPRFTIYNKKDLIKDGFMPRLYPHLLVSARSEEDMTELIERIQQKMIETMVPYEMLFTAERAGEIARLKLETLVEEMKYLEESNQYFVKGYAKQQSSWLGHAK